MSLSLSLYNVHSIENPFHFGEEKEGYYCINVIYKKIKNKSISPRIEPCGTHDKMSCNLKVLPFNTTFCLRSHNHSPIQAATLPLIP